MDLSGTSIGVVGALKAFPLRSAAKRLADRGARVHRGLPRGTTMAVFCRSLLSRLGPGEIEGRVAAARESAAELRSESGLMRLIGLSTTAAPGTLPQQSLLDQSGLSETSLDMLALFDAFEHDRAPFSFRDLILAKKYAGLIASGAGWHDIARSLHAVGPVGSLTALTLEARGERILALDAHSLAELDGQRLLPLPEQDDEAEDYFSHAEVAEQAGLFAEAATLYAHCAAIDPSDATAPFNEGNCRRELGELDAALLAYAVSLKRDPAFVESWFNCAGVLRDLGRIEAARTHLRRAIEIDPAYADAVYNLAALDYDTNNLPDAAAGWRRYLELDDTSDWARRARAGIALVAQIRSQAG
ncbi:tetratricopeptide repeat protein [Pelagibacterium xiamenense]|uniref:tetratricopeptide repeat protein n=1 Tax=Pelagibacterium xiamenense TaxID=2901140 RepID=UPI001E3B0DC8|nr:tetratricopeptide repeat protein [Pelagibacterium xiamenense]MCD7059677.1 tetratricopeptide repeat protein [Pelagibacterium xiamenense]